LICDINHATVLRTKSDKGKTFDELMSEIRL
jgi:hypothetical protein